MIYRIFYSDGNDRDELGRVNAPNMDRAIEYALKQYFKPELEYTENGDNECTYLMIDSCKFCDKKELMMLNDIEEEEELCEYCEVSEYIEIVQDSDAKPEYKTIYGVNEYADLSSDVKPTAYNPTLVKAWRKNPQVGATELMYQTINNNPEMVEAIDIEYLKRINKNHKELI